MTAYSTAAAEVAVRGFSAYLAARDRPLTKPQRADVDSALRVLAAPSEVRSMTTERAVIPRLRETRDTWLRDGEAILAAAASENRNLDGTEELNLATISTKVTDLNGKIRALEDEDVERRVAAEARAKFSDILDTPTEIRAGRGAEIYRPDGEYSFWADMLGAQMGHGASIERLARNDHLVSDAKPEYRSGLGGSEQRAGTTGSTSMGSFTPPVWLLDEIATMTRQGRVIPELCTSAGVPQSTSITVPRITTGSATAIQATENSSVGTTDLVTAQLTRTTSTIAGYVDTSIQSLELSPMAVDRMLFADLTADFNRAFDSQCVIGTGANNQLLGLDTLTGLNVQTWTQASPTAVLFYSQIAQAINTVYTTRFAPPDAIVMHPRRFAWLCSAADTTGRPLISPEAGGSFNPAGLGSIGGSTDTGRVGTMLGLPIYVTTSIPTTISSTQDEVYVARFSDQLVMESPLRAELFRDVGRATATVRARVYSFVNYFCGRYPGSVTRITGSGLTTPAFP